MAEMSRFRKNAALLKGFFDAKGLQTVISRDPDVELQKVEETPLVIIVPGTQERTVERGGYSTCEYQFDIGFAGLMGSGTEADSLDDETESLFNSLASSELDDFSFVSAVSLTPALQAPFHENMMFLRVATVTVFDGSWQ